MKLPCLCEAYGKFSLQSHASITRILYSTCAYLPGPRFDRKDKATRIPAILQLKKISSSERRSIFYRLGQVYQVGSYLLGILRGEATLVCPFPSAIASTLRIACFFDGRYDFRHLCMSEREHSTHGKLVCFLFVFGGISVAYMAVRNSVSASRGIAISRTLACFIQCPYMSQKNLKHGHVLEWQF